MRYYTGSCETKWAGDGTLGVNGDECPVDVIDWALREVVGVEDEEDVWCDIDYSYHAEEYEPADSFPDFFITIDITGVGINGFTCPDEIKKANIDVFEQKIREHLCEKHHLED